jgi:hypothetical protein
MLAECSLAFNLLFREGVRRAKNDPNKLSTTRNKMYVHYTKIEPERRENT